MSELLEFLAMSDFQFQEIFEFGPDETEYRKLSSDHVSVVLITR